MTMRRRRPKRSPGPVQMPFSAKTHEKDHEHLLGVFHLCHSEKKEMRKEEGFLPCKVSPGSCTTPNLLACSPGVCHCHSTQRSNLHRMNQPHLCPISKGKRPTEGTVMLLSPVCSFFCLNLRAAALEKG